VFKNPKFRACTIFVSITAFFNQLTGINAVVICSTLILEQVPGLDITLGNDLLAAAMVLGTIIGPILNRCISIKNLFLIGAGLMCVALALAAMFNHLGLPYGLLICVMVFHISYQISLGSYFFTYIAQVGNPSINTIGVFFTWFWILIISLITPPLIANLGVSITFWIYSGFAIGGGVYIWFQMRATEGLSKEQIKVLYAAKTQANTSEVGKEIADPTLPESVEMTSAKALIKQSAVSS